MQLFVDLDGVLADFDTHHETVFGFRSDKQLDNVDWQKIRSVKDFYEKIPPMPDMQELWSFVSKFEPTILTGIPWSVEEAETNKRSWIRKHLGENVRVICCKSKDKCLFATKGDILIDDWDKYQHLWEEKGGRWITHTSATSTISQLLGMGLG